MIFLFVFLGLLLLIALFFLLRFNVIKRLFASGNVIVTGLRGSGKDMLMSNVIARRRSVYVSNIDYKLKRCPRIALNLNELDTLNNYKNYIDNRLVPYEYPYPEKADIYISDAGVYFPSQYQGQLCRDYEGVVGFQALSRHLGDCNFHCNVQNLNRLWDKIREQSDIYIRCLSCRVVGKLVFQKIIVYDKYDSCLNRVQPYRHIRLPLFGSSRSDCRSRDEIALREFIERNGSVKAYKLVYFNRSKYDTRLFKSLLSGGTR